VGDFNLDGWPDVFVANDRGYEYGGDQLLWNRNSQLELDSNCNCYPTQSAMGADIGDINNDALLDIVIGDVQRNHVLQNMGSEEFVDVTTLLNANQMQMEEMSWGLRIVDVNNDGSNEIIFAQGDHTYPGLDNPEYIGPLSISILMRDGEGFREVATRLGFTDSGSFRSIVPLHWNQDGILDYWITDVEKGGQLWLSNGCDSGNWINFKGPIGTAIRFTSNGQTYYGEVQNSSSYAASVSAHWHVGLGNTEKIDNLEIRLPTEDWKAYPSEIEINQTVTLSQ